MLLDMMIERFVWKFCGYTVGLFGYYLNTVFSFIVG